MITAILIAIAMVFVVPLSFLTIEVLAALLPSFRKPATAPRPRCAVLVPAHNEEAGLRATLDAILPQLLPTDRLVVVADNCTDGTAANARAAGATVAERQDLDRRGKGFALDHGIRFLAEDPPEVVVVVDADCLVELGAVDALARQVAATGRPAQAVYTMEGRSGHPLEEVSAFAVRLKNEVRPLGLSRLGLPCLLTGAGMAFPWAAVSGARLAHGNIVEDLQLGIDLAMGGLAPQFCPAARTRATLPTGRRATVTQRTRWEHGHLQTLGSQVPRLLLGAIHQRRLGLLGLALELGVPPLSLLFLLWGVALVLLTAAYFLGESAIPAFMVLMAGVGAILALFSACARYGRKALSLRVLLTVPWYALGKLPLYGAFLFRRQREWVRTERTKPEVGP